MLLHISILLVAIIGGHRTSPPRIRCANGCSLTVYCSPNAPCWNFNPYLRLSNNDPVTELCMDNTNVTNEIIVYPSNTSFKIMDCQSLRSIHTLSCKEEVQLELIPHVERIITVRNESNVLRCPELFANKPDAVYRWSEISRNSRSEKRLATGQNYTFNWSTVSYTATYRCTAESNISKTWVDFRFNQTGQDDSGNGHTTQSELKSTLMTELIAAPTIATQASRKEKHGGTNLVHWSICASILATVVGLLALIVKVRKDKQKKQHPTEAVFADRSEHKKNELNYIEIDFTGFKPKEWQPKQREDCQYAEVVFPRQQNK